MKPILFNTEMVRAILDGRKTQTRRVIKPQTVTHNRSDGQIVESLDEFMKRNRKEMELLCAACAPYQPGDILWVRETTYLYGKWIKNGLTETGRQKYRFVWDKSFPVIYAADDKPDLVCTKKNEVGYFKRPSIFMTKEAARIFLKVINVRVERLQEITEEDARAEGVGDPYDYQEPQYYDQHHMRGLEINTSAFAGLWDKLNAKRDGGIYAWDKNPWVWVIEFERTEKP